MSASKVIVQGLYRDGGGAGAGGIPTDLNVDVNGNIEAVIATGPVTVADGADVTLGAIGDATVAGGATGTISAKLRRLTTDMTTLLTYVDGLEAALAGTLTTKELRSGTATTSVVADNAASVTLLALNSARLGCTVRNDSTADLYLKCGTTASLTDYTVVIPPGGYWEAPYSYTGRIDGIWATDPNTGAARITEFT